MAIYSLRANFVFYSSETQFLKWIIAMKQQMKETNLKKTPASAENMLLKKRNLWRKEDRDNV